MKIIIDKHTLERAIERGATESEIKNVILTGEDIQTKYNRIGKSKIFDFKTTRLNKYYEHKRVEVFYVVDGGEIVTVTVYVFYGYWNK